MTTSTSYVKFTKSSSSATTPTSHHAADSPEYTRLHVTPLDDKLINTLLSAPLRAAAKNISYHVLETFPESRYGFLDLPLADAEKLRKKFHGTVFKGVKMRVEKARASSMPVPDPEAIVKHKPDAQSKRRHENVDNEVGKKRGGHSNTESTSLSLKRKRVIGQEEERTVMGKRRLTADSYNVVAGVELPEGRKVKRGWTTTSEEAQKEKIKAKRLEREAKKKEKERKKQGADDVSETGKSTFNATQKRKQVVSRYTDREECIVQVAIGANAPPVAKEKAKKNAKTHSKSSSGISTSQGKSATKVMLAHEFSETTKFPTFLKDDSSTFFASSTSEPVSNDTTHDDIQMKENDTASSVSPSSASPSDSDSDSEPEAKVPDALDSEDLVMEEAEIGEAEKQNEGMQATKDDQRGDQESDKDEGKDQVSCPEVLKKTTVKFSSDTVKPTSETLSLSPSDDDISSSSESDNDASTSSSSEESDSDDISSTSSSEDEEIEERDGKFNATPPKSSRNSLPISTEITSTVEQKVITSTELVTPKSKVPPRSPTAKPATAALSLDIPPPPVHPLEALYKKKYAGTDENAAAEETGDDAPFSFFGNDGSDEEMDTKNGTLGASKEEDASRSLSVTVPLTPYTQRDIEMRHVRSAAPTPDTAHPSRAPRPLFSPHQWNLSPENLIKDAMFHQSREFDSNMTGQSLFEEDREVGDVSVPGIEEEGQEEDEESSTRGKPSDFANIFWEKRGELAKSWKTRRKSAMREKRIRETRVRFGRK